MYFGEMPRIAESSNHRFYYLVVNLQVILLSRSPYVEMHSPIIWGAKCATFFFLLFLRLYTIKSRP